MGIFALWRILEFLNVLYVLQQLGNRTLPRARPEPWMANVERLRQIANILIRAYRMSYIRNPAEICQCPYSASQPVFTALKVGSIKFRNRKRGKPCEI